MDNDKPGVKTTEFLALGGVFAICLLNEKLGIGLSPDDIKQLLAVTVVAYIAGRSVKKIGQSFAPSSNTETSKKELTS